MRTLLAALGCLVATAATAASNLDVTVLPRPAYPAPETAVGPPGPRLVLVSSRYRDPAILPPERPAPPSWAPRSFRGQELQTAVRQLGVVFLLYGPDADSGRYVVAANPRTRKLRYAFDLVNFTRPPQGGWFEPVTWAREIDGVLYVENTHLTYASASRNRNAYLSAIDLAKRTTRWRSPALVANARTFVVAGGLIVAGYGFTAERDFLYLLDRVTGNVVDRLPLPTAPEVVKLRGDRLHVRTYDRDVVVRIARS